MALCIAGSKYYPIVCILLFPPTTLQIFTYSCNSFSLLYLYPQVFHTCFFIVSLSLLGPMELPLSNYSDDFYDKTIQQILAIFPLICYIKLKRWELPLMNEVAHLRKIELYDLSLHFLAPILSKKHLWNKFFVFLQSKNVKLKITGAFFNFLKNNQFWRLFYWS